MKTLVLWLCFLFTCILQPAFSQNNGGFFRLVKMTWQSDKKLMIDQLMEFNEKEANQFWPVYDKHMQKWGRLMEYRIAITEEYCDEFGTRKGTQTSLYIKELVQNDIELTRLQKKLFAKVRKILPATRANQFMELEYEFQLVLLSQLQQRTSYIGDNFKRL